MNQSHALLGGNRAGLLLLAACLACLSGKARLVRALMLFAGLAVTVLVTNVAGASETMRQAGPVPDSVKKDEPAISFGFTERPISERFLMKRLKASLEKRDDFWRDTRFAFDSRTYDFRRRNSSTDKPEATVTGGQLVYQSGLWRNFGLRAAYYNSTELDSSGGDTGLLAPDQGNISIIGEANLRYEFQDGWLKGAQFTGYRQTLDLPYINRHDIRQVPASHDGLVLRRDDSSFDFAVGHLNQFKNFDSEEFEPMSQRAGAPGTSKGVTLAGARLPFGKTFNIGAINYLGWDTFNTFFVEATYFTPLTNGVELRLSGQFTDQRSVGDDLVGNFDTYHTAGKAALSWKGAILTVAASITDDGAAIRKPWGGSPSYLSIQRLDFDRANEKAWLIGLSYNTDFFSKLGLSSFVNIARGNSAKSSVTGDDLPDQTEYDLTVDYKPPGGLLEGLWVRLRYNYIDIDGSSETVQDWRLILNYSVPFL